MANRHEEIMTAVTALVTGVMPGVKVRRVAADTAKPTRLDPGGDVLVRDGDPGEPEVFMSPLTYVYTRRISLEVAPYNPENFAVSLAAMIAPLGPAIEADRTLGGKADWMEPEAPQIDDTDIVGASPLRWAEIGLVVTYGTSNPLG